MNAILNNNKILLMCIGICPCAYQCVCMRVCLSVCPLWNKQIPNTVKRLIIGDNLFGEIGEFKKSPKLVFTK